jgi:hypothetical protein
LELRQVQLENNVLWDVASTKLEINFFFTLVVFIVCNILIYCIAKSNITCLSDDGVALPDT